MVANPDTLQLNFESALPAQFKKLALAVSGGSDSVALLKLAHDFSQRSVNSPVFIVLSVDHKLRDTSVCEVEFVRKLCEKLGLEFHDLSWEGKKPSSGLQEAARAARYSLMIEKCRELQVDALLTAHTMDDQVETFLMRLKRGSGLDGLSAMSPVSEMDGFVILRPLLRERRESLRSYLREQTQDWIEDPSNQDAGFERVHIRAQIHELEGMGFKPAHLAQSASRLMRARQLIEETAHEAISSQVRWYEAGFCQISNESFAKLNAEIALRVLSHMLLAVGGGSRAPQLKKLEHALESWHELSPGAGFTLAGCRLVMKKSGTIIVRETTRDSDGPTRNFLSVSPGDKKLWDRRFWCEVSSLDPHKTKVQQLCVKALGEEGWHRAKAQTDKCGGMPSYIGRSLVSLWHGDELLSVPHIGLKDKKISFAARFKPKGVMNLPRMRPYFG